MWPPRDWAFRAENPEVGTHTRQEDGVRGMGLGGTAKKLQKVAEMAEDVYARLNDLRDQIREMRKAVDETKDRVDSLETESAEQRAILEAMAEQQGIDVEAVTATAHIKEAEADAAAEAGDADAADAADADAVDADATDATDAGAADTEPADEA